MGKCLFMRKGETHTAPSGSILASNIAVGSTVKLIENGSPVDYLVVHSGRPSTMYDSSCNGLWLLRKNIIELVSWDSTNNDYANSDIHTSLNGTFFNTLGITEQAAIKQVKIPYRPSSGYNKTVNSGASGLSTKVFLLSAAEVSYNFDYMPTNEGVELAYFAGCADSGADSKRVAYLNGSANSWSLRSPVCNNRYYADRGINYVNSNGDYNYDYVTSPGNKRVRPTLILPHTAIFDEKTMVLKGVA